MVSGVVLAAPPPEGIWYGQSIVGARPIAMTLKLTSTKGDVVGLLAAGSPRQCRVHLANASQNVNGSWSFSVTGSNGGICDGLIGKPLTLQASTTNHLAFEVAGLSGEVATAATYAPIDVDGDWVAQGDANANGAGPRVHLEASIPSGRDSTWRYAGNRSCSLEAEYAGVQSGSDYFSFSHSNGGFCDRFADGYVELTRRTDGGLDYRMYLAGDTKPTESGVLGRAQP